MTADSTLTAIAEYRLHLIDEIQNGHGANRAGYERVVAKLDEILAPDRSDRAAYYERVLCNATSDWPLNPEQEWCSGLKGHTGDHESASYQWTNR